MMPSASSKPDNKGSVEPTDPMKNAITVIEKKVRNLEKRKGKLDAYRQMRMGGDKLNKDQEEAIAKYDSVLLNLEFARELQKQFVAIQGEADKLLKKQAKRERMERQAVEIRRVQEVLQLQSTLDLMGSEEVRTHFLAGTSGAVKLSQDDLDHLDVLYKLISPSRDTEPSYEEQLTQASEHIVNFLDAKEKEVAGTTYKDLKELVLKINDCDYFDKSQENEAEEAAEEPEEAAEEQEEEEEEKEDLANDNFLAPEPQPIQHHEVQSNLLSHEATTEDISNMAALSDSHQVAGQTGAYPQVDDESFFTTEPFPRPRPFQVTRPFKEIVSSVQGTFNFLQESQIMSEVAASDPAVIVATSTSLAHQESHLVQPTSYKGSSLLGEATSQSAVSAESLGGAADHSSSLVSQQYGSSSQDYYMSSQPPNSTGISFMAEQIASMDQGLGGASDIPPAIPMPNQTSLSMGGGEASQDQLGEDKKPLFTMNPNAKMFRSMYQGEQNSGNGFSQSGALAEDGYQSHDYQGGFGNGYGQRSGRGRGGPRGGNGNRGNMSNGYMRGGRNGNPNGGGSYGDRRREGGYSNGNSGNRGGNRGSRNGPPRGGQMRGGRAGMSSGFPSRSNSAAQASA